MNKHFITIKMGEGYAKIGKNIRIPLIKKSQYLGLLYLAINKKIQSGASAMLRVNCKKKLQAGSKIMLQSLGNMPNYLTVYPNIVKVGEEILELRIKNKSSRPINLRKFGPIGCALTIHEREPLQKGGDKIGDPPKNAVNVQKQTQNAQTSVAIDDETKDSDDIQTTSEDRTTKVNDSQYFVRNKNSTSKFDENFKFSPENAIVDPTDVRGTGQLNIKEHGYINTLQRAYFRNSPYRIPAMPIFTKSNRARYNYFARQLDNDSGRDSGKYYNNNTQIRVQRIEHVSPTCLKEAYSLRHSKTHTMSGLRVEQAENPNTNRQCNILRDSSSDVPNLAEPDFRYLQSENKSLEDNPTQQQGARVAAQSLRSTGKDNDVTQSAMPMEAQDSAASKSAAELCCERLGLNIGKAMTEDEDKKYFQEMIKRNESCFAVNNKQLTGCITLQASIKLKKDAKPVRIRQFPLSAPDLAEMTRQVLELERCNMVSKSLSMYNSPAFLVRKLNKEPRIVVDYRMVNQTIERENFAIPTLDDIINKIGSSGATVWSSVDLRSAYRQISIREADRDITSFTVANLGSYRFNSLPMGLVTSGGLFAYVMSCVLDDRELQQGMVIYLDDIVIFSKDVKSHLDLLERLFACLNKASLKLHNKKSEFMQTSIRFLGHTFHRNGITIADEKLKPILEFPAPKNRKEIKTFCGMISYLRAFIKNLSGNMVPFLKLLKGNTKFVWGKEQQDAFLIIKKQLKELPKLSYAIQNSNYPYIIETDASDKSVAGVLLQRVDGVERLISSFGRNLRDAETRYSTNDKEILAILLCILKFQHLIAGKPLEIRTDSITATAFKNMKGSHMSRSLRWSQFLSPYLDTATFSHIAGSKNLLADALSRVNYTEDSEISTKLEKELLQNEFTINFIGSELAAELELNEQDEEYQLLNREIEDEEEHEQNKNEQNQENNIEKNTSDETLESAHSDVTNNIDTITDKDWFKSEAYTKLQEKTEMSTVYHFNYEKSRARDKKEQQRLNTVYDVNKISQSIANAVKKEIQQLKSENAAKIGESKLNVYAPEFVANIHGAMPASHSRCEADSGPGGRSQAVQLKCSRILSPQIRHGFQIERVLTRQGARQERLKISQAQNVSCENCQEHVIQRLDPTGCRTSKKRTTIIVSESEYKRNIFTSKTTQPIQEVVDGPTDEAVAERVETEEVTQKMKDDVEKAVWGFERHETKSFAELQMACPLVRPMMRYLMYGELDEKDEKFRRKIVAEAEFHFINDDGILCYYKKNQDRTKSLCDVIEARIVPLCLRQKIVELTHSFSHPGVARNIKIIQSAHYRWDTMYKMVRDHVFSCRSCIQSKRGLYSATKCKIVGLQRPNRPFFEVCIDPVGPMPLSSRGNQYFLQVIDSFSNYNWLIPMKDIQADTIAEHLLEVFTMTGIPWRCRSDQGSSITGKVLSKVFKLMGITQVTTLSENKRCNPAEREIKESLNLLRCRMQGIDPKRWDEMTPLVQFAQRLSVSQYFPLSPSEILFGFRPRGILEAEMEPEQEPSDLEQSEYVTQLKLRLKKLWALQAEMREENRKTICEKYNKKAKDIEYSVGDIVLLRNENTAPGQSAKFRNEYREDEYEIMDIISPHSFRLRNCKKNTFNKLPVYKDRIRKVFIPKKARGDGVSDGVEDGAPFARPEPHQSPPVVSTEQVEKVKSNANAWRVNKFIPVQEITASRSTTRGTEYKVKWKHTQNKKFKEAWIPENELEENMIKKYKEEQIEGCR